ncbi:GNAT family N-acetyltransferase [Pseudoxanthomonas sp. 22568]|uniref:GNAT family N-acetyltransferase n=1 Tax=Pseudoxanthomonas sp. 22568 TaxID=3453945 RepID=UPI003F878398
MDTLHIRPATTGDLDAMWTIFRAVIAPGDALPFDEGFDRDTFREHWFGAHAASVAEQGGEVIGMYKLGANHAGRGAHVASATYAVAPAMQGRGVGRRLVEHSLARARAAGFRGIQFNYVVSTNGGAVELYRRLGFDIVGTLPGAFRHERLGWVDAYVMFRALEPPEADAKA